MDALWLRSHARLFRNILLGERETPHGPQTLDCVRRVGLRPGLFSYLPYGRKARNPLFRMKYGISLHHNTCSCDCAEVPLRRRFRDCRSSTISAAFIRLHKWMGEPVSVILMIEQDRRISEVIAEERPRLRNFIRRRVPDEADVEDLLQEVFFELVEAYRLLKPIDYVTGWLFALRAIASRISFAKRSRRPSRIWRWKAKTASCCGLKSCCPPAMPGRKRSTSATRSSRVGSCAERAARRAARSVHCARIRRPEL